MKFVWLLPPPKTKVYSSSTPTTKHTPLDLRLRTISDNECVGRGGRVPVTFGNCEFSFSPMKSSGFNRITYIFVSQLWTHNRLFVLNACLLVGLFIIPLRRPYTLQLLLHFDRTIYGPKEIDARYIWNSYANKYVMYAVLTLIGCQTSS